jgi:hypothetical protein
MPRHAAAAHSRLVFSIIFEPWRIACRSYSDEAASQSVRCGDRDGDRQL